VTIAVVDSGIQSNGDLDTTEMSGFDFEGGGGSSSGWDRDPDDHGTPVAALIAADRDGNGITGIAFDADLVSYNYVTSSGGGTTDTNLTALINRHVLDLVDISNNSWGLEDSFISNDPDLPSDFLGSINAFETAQNSSAGTIFIWASGNDGTFRGGPKNDVASLAGLPLSDARLEDQWLVVTSVDESLNESYFTTRCASAHDFCVTAIGEGVTSTNPSGNLSVYDGTSFAAPQVSGLLALVMEAFPSLSSSQVVNRVKTTATYDGLRAWDGCTQAICSTAQMQQIFGHGLIDPIAATGVVGSLTVSVDGPTLSESRLSVPRGISSQAINGLGARTVTAFDSFDGAGFDVPVSSFIRGQRTVAPVGYSASAANVLNDTEMQAITFAGQTLRPVLQSQSLSFWGHKNGFVEDDAASRSMGFEMPLGFGIAALGETRLITETDLQHSAGLRWNGRSGTSVQALFGSGIGLQGISTVYGAQTTSGFEQTVDLGLRHRLRPGLEVFGATTLTRREDLAPGLAQWGHRNALFAYGVAGLELSPIPGLSLSGGAYLPETQIRGDALISFADGGSLRTFAVKTGARPASAAFLAGRLVLPGRHEVALSASLQQDPDQPNVISRSEGRISLQF
jgi:subtilase-type serine protease